MREELTTLLTVQEHDEAIRKLKRRSENATTSVKDATSTLHQMAKALADQEAKCAASAEEERELARRIEQYERQRDRAMKILESGMGDPEAAERQRIGSIELLDTAETEMLELMDRIEGEQVELAKAQQVRDAAESALEEHKAAEPVIHAEDAAQIEVHLGERTTHAAKLPDEILDRYERISKRKRTAVSMLDGGACSACLICPAQQQLSNIKSGRFLEECRGCQRWLAFPE